MALMEVILQQRYMNQQIINRWNYLSAGTPAAATLSVALATAFGAIPAAGVYPVDTVISHLAALQETGVAFESVIVRDVYSNIDFYQTPFVPAKTGAVAGSGVGAFVSFGFVSSKTRTDIRRGTKRFTGVVSGSYAGDNIFTGGVLTDLQDLATAMSATITFDDEGNELAFAPVIVGREKLPLPDTDPQRWTYHYYETFAEQSTHLMESIFWSPYAGPRSQTSRQIGRGS